MAHFAQLDENNVVIQVIVVNNEDCLDESGVESEAVGIAFCQGLLGMDTRWKQTSYNHTFRRQFAGIGCSYHEGADVFVGPQPYPSWVFDEVGVKWVAPIPEPEAVVGQSYVWDEDNQVWDTTFDLGEV